MKIKCPQCQSHSPDKTKNAFWPFCCERCKLIDLGAWASEEYRIESDERATLDDDMHSD